MKHIDIRAAWVQQLRNADKVKLVQVAGANNEADYFTKILPRPASIAAQRLLMHDLLRTSQESAEGQGSVCDGVPSSKKRGRAAGKKKKRNKTETKGTASTKAAELEDQEKSLDLP